MCSIPTVDLALTIPVEDILVFGTQLIKSLEVLSRALLLLVGSALYLILSVKPFVTGQYPLNGMLPLLWLIPRL